MVSRSWELQRVLKQHAGSQSVYFAHSHSTVIGQTKTHSFWIEITKFVILKCYGHKRAIKCSIFSLKNAKQINGKHQPITQPTGHSVGLPASHPVVRSGRSASQLAGHSVGRSAIQLAIQSVGRPASQTAKLFSHTVL